MIRARRDERLRASLSDVHPLPGVRAGSALVRWENELLVVQDDAFEMAWITPRGVREPLVRIVGVTERLGPLPKYEKPDFEAAVVHDGAIHVFGSGSAGQRRMIARLVPRPHELARRDAGAFYDAIARALAEVVGTPLVPNVEGAIVSDAALTVFHRGAGDVPSVAIALDVGVLERGEARVRSVVALDLGRVGDVPLALTDAVAVPGGFIYFACAEDTPNAIEDGPIVGSAVGVVRGDDARFIELMGPSGELSLDKCEGLALDDHLRGGYVVTDPDTPERPAHLARLTLDGPWVD